MAGSVPAPGYYVWEVPGKWISIELNLDVVDALQQDVIRGFGALPRRGAEVGGILLGNVSGGGRIVRIQGHKEVPIEYRRGPSYLLSEADQQTFASTLSNLRSSSTVSSRPIGYFRSHTRDGVGLGEEDLDLIGRCFPDPETVVLLIRPFGTKPSLAGFYFKEDGKFQEGPPLRDFPFSRRDLAADDVPPGVERPARRPQPRARGEREALSIPATVPVSPPPAEPLAAPVKEAAPVEAEMPVAMEVATQPPPKAESKFRSGGIWVPLSILFLVAGVLLGFQLAMTIGPRPLSRSDPYKLSLSATPSGNDLELKWDRQAPLVRRAQKGILSIEDGAYRKSIDLDPERLQGSSEVVYRHASNQVRIRLEVFLKDSGSVAETVDWKK